MVGGKKINSGPQKKSKKSLQLETLFYFCRPKQNSFFSCSSCCAQLSHLADEQDFRKTHFG